MVYAVGALAGSNHLTISRNSGGEVVVQAQNMRSRDLGFLGSVTGSATIVLGSTDGGYGTEHQVYGQTGTRFDVTDASQNISFNSSSGLKINLLDNNNEANIQLNNVSGSTVDATNTSRATMLQATAGSNNNYFNMGWADAQIVDGGSYNITQLGSGTAYYASLASSKGAVVLGGAGNATYNIAGSYGVFQQGSGMAMYAINTNYSGSEGSVKLKDAYGKYNTILSSSVSSIIDQGYASYINSSNPASTVTFNGIQSIGELGTLSRVTFGENADGVLAYANGEASFKNKDEDAYSRYGEFNLNKTLYQIGFHNGTESQRSFLQESGHASNQTSSLVGSLLASVLAKGNAGYEYLYS